MVPQDGIRQPLRLLIRHLPYDITTEALLDVVHRSCDKTVMESIKEVYVICGYPPQNNRPKILSTAVLVVQLDGSIAECEAVIRVVTDIFDGHTVFPEMEATASAVELSPIYLASFSKTRGNAGPNRDIEVEFQHGNIEEDEDYQRFCAMIKVETEELKYNAITEKIQDWEQEDEEVEEKQKQECSDKCVEKPVSMSLLVHELLGKIEKLEKSEKESKKMSVKDIRLRLLYQSQLERERDERKNHIKPHDTEYKQETKCKLQKRSKERKLVDGVYSTRKSGADVKSEKVHRMSSQNIRKKRKEERRNKRSCDRVEKSVSACRDDRMGRRRDRRKKSGDKKNEGDIIDVPRKQRRRREKDVSMKNEYNLEEKKRKHWEKGLRQKTKSSKPNEFDEQQLHKKYQRSKKSQQENRYVRRLLSGKRDKMDKNAESTKSITGENSGKNIMLEKKYVDPCREDGSFHASRPPKSVNMGVDTKECSSPIADKVRERQRRRERRDKKNFERKAKNQPLVLRILTRPDESTSIPPNNF